MDKQDAPVLILGYNRPDKISALISDLRLCRPQNIYFAVDGPKPNKNSDENLVAEVRDCINEINWTDGVTPIFREQNLGMRISIPGAVSEVVRKHGKVIVLEDDLRISPSFLDFSNWALREFEQYQNIGHICGYSAVPGKELSLPDKSVRLSKFAQSFGWATWERAWSNYDDSMFWFQNLKANDLLTLFNDPIAAAHWWLILENVRTGRISSWAYRWLQSLWSQNQVSVVPNKSLVVNHGYDTGSHTLTKPAWDEPELNDFLDLLNLGQVDPVLDLGAEHWTSKVLNRNNLPGFIREVAVTAVRSLVQEKH